ncbi:MAG: type 1 glutamine amidotransferase [Fibrobacteres bacterium]|nr:type 1 glutamine amidotransferase [Fibrobacterota bacterium]
MRIHFFEHSDIEGIGTFEDLLFERTWSATHTRWDLNQTPPDPSQWDLLVVMGGPMNVYEDANHPWLVAEKAYLDRVLALGLPVLGVCLGAQLLAERLGAEVTRNEYTEIGWSELMLEPAMRAPGALFDHMPAVASVFQWHGDTFAIPQGADRIGSTEACRNQGFVKGNTVALQFHLELEPDALRGLVRAQPHFRGPFIQKPDAFLANAVGFRTNRDWLGAILDKMAKRVQPVASIKG